MAKVIINYKPLLPNAHFGAVGKQHPTKWQDHDEHDVDDEELQHTPPDVKLMLGFDPKRFARRNKK